MHGQRKDCRRSCRVYRYVDQAYPYVSCTCPTRPRAWTMWNGMGGTWSVRNTDHGPRETCNCVDRAVHCRLLAYGLGLLMGMGWASSCGPGSRRYLTGFTKIGRDACSPPWILLLIGCVRSASIICLKWRWMDEWVDNYIKESSQPILC